MSFPSLIGISLWALVIESIPWLLFPGSRVVKFIFLPAIYCFIFDASLWCNGCIPMSFSFLVGISAFLKGGVGLLFVFEMDEVVVVVKFLSIYLLEIYFWSGILVCHPARFFIFVLISLSRCVWWWLPCNPVCGSSHGTLYAGIHCSRILSFTIKGNHFRAGS